MTNDPVATVRGSDTNMTKSKLVAIGLRAKTARAIAVVLGGPQDSPVVLAKTEIKLFDPKVAATAQPYHEVMDLAWPESQQAVRKLETRIEAVATAALARLIDAQRAHGTKIVGVGIIGAKDRDLSRIGNAHIRAHAAEGILFRRVLDYSAQANCLKFRTFAEKEFENVIKSALGSKSASLKKKIADLRNAVPAPWRTDEKLAALAAWMVLHSQQGLTTSR